MQLIIVKKNAKGEVSSEVSASFNNFSEYHKFLEANGIFITEEDAISEFQQSVVQYNLPLEV